MAYDDAGNVLGRLLLPPLAATPEPRILAPDEDLPIAVHGIKPTRRARALLNSPTPGSDPAATTHATQPTMMRPSSILDGGNALIAVPVPRDVLAAAEAPDGCLPAITRRAADPAPPDGLHGTAVRARKERLAATGPSGRPVAVPVSVADAGRPNPGTYSFISPPQA